MPIPGIIVMNMPAFSNANTRKFVQRRLGARPGNGFALLEVLVALLLFSIGILGLLSLQASSISTAGDAEDRNRAALLADRCASQMQLQAPNVTMTNGASGLAAICQSQDWSDYVKDPTQGGLPGGEIKLTAPTAYNTVSGGPPLVPLTYGITVTWTPPVHESGASPTTSQLSTQVTLLVQNS
ncbi:MAG: prepilin-type N-terminal cleavage/methylation domain-containing protein [Burkholderiaceae bacterium]|jgi:type IV pilus assembly protein PilV|nr:prepilin-type N-terminal cleavage/methylation domain-containing protein [Burkholderiaceae bacterium]